MSAEANLLQDLVLEFDELLESSRGADDQYRAGLMHAAGIVQHQLQAFEIDQSHWSRRLRDVEAWFLGTSQK